MTAPSYSLHDPRGWGGDPKRGAALGRPTVKDTPRDFTGRLYLKRIPLNSGGYDPNGTYFGIGAPLYWCAEPDGTIDFVFRARDRAEAIEIARQSYPNARIRR